MKKEKENKNKNKSKHIKKNKIKKSKASILLYIFAIISLVCTALSVYDTYNYINQLASYGSINMSTQILEIINYYITTSSQFVFYTVIFASIGHLINKVTVVKNLIQSNLELTVVENKKEAQSDKE